MTQPIKTAIVGVGLWGKNVARELADASGLVYFASKHTGTDLPGIQRATVEEICADESIQAVAVATPVETHAEIVGVLLHASKHVLCEKPIAEDSGTANDLVVLAQRKQRTLMTGYVLLYSPVYQEFKRIVLHDHPVRVECIRKKHGTFTDTIENALLTHHLAVAYDLFGMPESAETTMREAGETECDKIEVRLAYKGGEFISKIDRVSEERSHTITAELESGETLTWEDTKLYRGGELIFESEDTPLREEIRVFLEAAQGGGAPQTAGDFGERVLQIHEMLR